MRISIVAAHPDDESIGASSVLGLGDDVVVIHVTNGAPHDPRWWTGATDRESYRRIRGCEAERALGRVGVSRIALDFDDQEVVYQLEAVVDALARALARVAPDLIITHAYEGGHPDHDAVALAVARVRARIPVLEMALYHGAGGELVTGDFIERAPRVRYALNDAERARRRGLLESYVSQRAVLAPFLNLATECFRPARAYDFTRPPHDGSLHYERLGMKPTPAAWRTLALAAR